MAMEIYDDVSNEILLRLPAKSLIRFKSVCKSWHSIISANEFLRLHMLRHLKQPAPPSLILSAPTSESFYFHPFLNKLIPYNFPPAIPAPKILNSCKGLLLLESDDNYHVYNPTTKQSRKVSPLPLPTGGSNEEYPFVVGMTLAFHPSEWPHYRIVCVRSRMRRNIHCVDCFQILVYTSESGDWKMCLERQNFASIQVLFNRGVYCNNVVYWPGLGFAPYFDLAKNAINYFRYPRDPIPHNDITCVDVSRIQYLRELNGHLYCIVVGRYEVGCELVQVWEMQGENCEEPAWLMEYSDMITPPFCSNISLRSVAMSIVTGEMRKLEVCRFLKVDYVSVNNFGECLTPL